ncbi:MAG: hypothetical protein WC025_01145 [Candidatus Magasanikbacteria bacterium]
MKLIFPSKKVQLKLVLFGAFFGLLIEILFKLSDSRTMAGFFHKIAWSVFSSLWKFESWWMPVLFYCFVFWLFGSILLMIYKYFKAKKI